MTELNGQTETLRYLDADHVEHPSGTFAGHMLCSQDDEKPLVPASPQSRLLAMLASLPARP